MRYRRPLALTALCWSLSACTSVLPPTQAMSDARQAIQAARDARAARYAPSALAYAQRRLGRAEQELSSGSHAYVYAHFNALVAKEEALLAHKVAQGIQNAEQALAKAAALGQLPAVAEALLMEAEAVALQGELDAALLLATQAQERGEAAQAQAYLNAAKAKVRQLKAQRYLSLFEQVILQQAEAAIDSGQGAKALEFLKPNAANP